MKITFFALFLIVSGFLSAQSSTEETHNHLFDIHCAACDNPLGVLKHVGSKDSLHFSIAGDAIISLDGQFHCSVCNQPVFLGDNLLSSTSGFLFTQPKNETSLLFKSNKNTLPNLMSLCPVCIEKAQKHFRPGEFGTTLKFKEIKGIFK